MTKGSQDRNKMQVLSNSNSIDKSQIEDVREVHRNDSSISSVPKTGKAGVFEKERNLNESE